MQCIVRAKSGSTLAFTVSLCAVALSIGLFVLWYIRTIGTHAQQNSAIQAASLAFASDLGQIIIDDPYFGFVSLFDHAPQGQALAAGDNYGLPVHSYNSLLATVRSNLVLADLIGDEQMRSFALTDFQHIQSTQQALKSAIEAAVLPTAPPFQAADGTFFSPYSDAMSAYMQNLIRMNGKSTLVPNSLRISLGTVSTSVTQTPVPLPRTLDKTLQESLVVSGNYVPNKTVNYRGSEFIFAAVESAPILISANIFQSAVASGAMPTGIKVEADQAIAEGNKGFTLHDVSFAEVGGIKDTFMNPGAFVFTAPDGIPTEFTTLLSLIKIPPSKKIVATFKTAQNGDFPQGTSKLALPSSFNYGSNPSTMSSGFELAYYSWFKRLGPFANLQSCLNMLKMPLLPSKIDNTKPIFITYESNTNDGTIQQSIMDCRTIYGANSDQQLFCAGNEAYATASTARYYDLVISTNVYQPGKTLGGIHGGEPLVDARLDPSINPPYGTSSPLPLQPLYAIPYLNSGWASPSGGYAFGLWSGTGTPWVPGGDLRQPQIIFPPQSLTKGALRPTLNTPGLAVEIALHRVGMFSELSPIKEGPWIQVQ